MQPFDARLARLAMPVAAQQLDLQVVERRDVNGFPTLKLTFIYDAKVPPGLTGTIDAGFEDLNFEDNQVWKEMTVYGSTGATFQTADEFTHEISRQLDSYPALDLVTTPNQDKAAWSWTVGSGSFAPLLPTLPAPKPIDLQVGGSGPLVQRGTTETVTKDGGLSIDWRIVPLLAAVIVAVVGIQLAIGRARRKASARDSQR